MEKPPWVADDQGPPVQDTGFNQMPSQPQRPALLPTPGTEDQDSPVMPPSMSQGNTWSQASPVTSIGGGETPGDVSSGGMEIPTFMTSSSGGMEIPRLMDMPSAGGMEIPSQMPFGGGMGIPRSMPFSGGMTMHTGMTSGGGMQSHMHMSPSGAMAGAPWLQPRGTGMYGNQSTDGNPFGLPFPASDRDDRHGPHVERHQHGGHVSHPDLTQGSQGPLVCSTNSLEKNLDSLLSSGILSSLQKATGGPGDSTGISGGGVQINLSGMAGKNTDVQYKSDDEMSLDSNASLNTQIEFQKKLDLRRASRMAQQAGMRSRSGSQDSGGPRDDRSGSRSHEGRRSESRSLDGDRRSMSQSRDEKRSGSSHRDVDERSGSKSGGYPSRDMDMRRKNVDMRSDSQSRDSDRRYDSPSRGDHHRHGSRSSDRGSKSRDYDRKQDSRYDDRRSDSRSKDPDRRYDRRREGSSERRRDRRSRSRSRERRHAFSRSPPRHKESRRRSRSRSPVDKSRALSPASRALMGNRNRSRSRSPSKEPATLKEPPVQDPATSTPARKSLFPTLGVSSTASSSGAMTTTVTALANQSPWVQSTDKQSLLPTPGTDSSIYSSPGTTPSLLPTPGTVADTTTLSSTPSSGQTTSTSASAATTTATNTKWKPVANTPTRPVSPSSSDWRSALGINKSPESDTPRRSSKWDNPNPPKADSKPESKPPSLSSKNKNPVVLSDEEESPMDIVTPSQARLHKRDEPQKGGPKKTLLSTPGAESTSVQEDKFGKFILFSGNSLWPSNTTW